MTPTAASAPAATRTPRTQAATSPARGEAGRRRIAIIGAGVGGLALSRALAMRGVPHVVLERGSEPGGVIRTIRVEDHVLEAGPQRTRLSHNMRELVRALRLEDQLVVAPRDLPLFIYRRGALRIAPLSLAQLRRTDLFGLAGKVRLLAEPITVPSRAGETVAQYFTRRFGRAAYEDLLGPLFGGLYASDPQHMLFRHALLPVLREMHAERSAVLAMLRGAFQFENAAACSFRDGMRTLTDAMCESVRAHVHLDTSALAIERDGHGFRILTPNGALEASHVVLTCAAGVAGELLSGVAPGTATALASLSYNPIVIVHMLADGVVRGMGYQVSFAEPLHTRGVTFNHALFGRDRVHTAFLGGARDADMAARPDAEIAEVATREFLQVTGCPATVIHVTRAAIPAWDRTWSALDDLVPPHGIHLCANYESRIGIAGRIARARQLAALIAE